MQRYDVIVIGGGAAGLLCAFTSGRRGRRVALLESNPRVGLKIAISGGGRCNFTNLFAAPENYLSGNPRFCASALARYTPQDFVALVEKHRIPFHEKKLGQLFCDFSSRQIIEMLLAECAIAEVEVRCSCRVESVEKREHFSLGTNLGTLECDSLVIATGGLSLPRLGASDFGYRIAEQFGIKSTGTRPGSGSPHPLRGGANRVCALERRGAAGRRARGRRVVCRSDAHHAPRLERTGDPADLLLLAGRRECDA